jgi:hypothetical protein
MPQTKAEASVAEPAMRVARGLDGSQRCEVVPEGPAVEMPRMWAESSSRGRRLVPLSGVRCLLRRTAALACWNAQVLAWCCYQDRRFALRRDPIQTPAETCSPVRRFVALDVLRGLPQTTVAPSGWAVLARAPSRVAAASWRSPLRPDAILGTRVQTA